MLVNKGSRATESFYSAPLEWGDRKGIEQQTGVWGQVIVDRSGELTEWASTLGKDYQRKVQSYTYANNHYAGCRHNFTQTIFYRSTDTNH